MFDNETPNGGDLDSGPVCQPLLQERKRRRESDAQIVVKLTSIEKTQRATLGCLVAMVLSAFLEYAGVIGKHEGEQAIWSKAVMDGVATLVQGAVGK